LDKIRRRIRLAEFFSGGFSTHKNSAANSAIGGGLGSNSLHADNYKKLIYLFYYEIVHRVQERNKKINSIKTALTRKRQMKVKQTDRLSQQTNYITAK